MYPRDSDVWLDPRLNLAGGIIGNALFGCLLIAAASICPTMTIRFILAISSCIHISCSLMNALSRDVCSDGMSIKGLKGINDARCFNAQLLITKNLAYGIAYKDMDDGLFFVGHVSRESSFYEVELYMFGYYRLKEKKDMNGARERLANLEACCKGDNWVSRETKRERKDMQTKS